MRPKTLRGARSFFLFRTSQNGDLLVLRFTNVSSYPPVRLGVCSAPGLRISSILRCPAIPILFAPPCLERTLKQNPHHAFLSYVYSHRRDITNDESAAEYF